MKTIFKWPLLVTDLQTVPMQMGAEILSVQIQDGRLQVWALINPSNHEARRLIAIFGTGHKMPQNPGKYIGTFQMQDGALVFHAFDQGEVT